MAAVTEVEVPDIGDFDAVPIVEVIVKVGDVIAVEDPIVELESDKASFEVPSTVAGTVKEIKVKQGDEVGQGDVLILVEEDGGDGAAGDDASGDDEAPVDGADAEATADAQAAAETEASAERETQPADNGGNGGPQANADAQPTHAGAASAQAGGEGDAEVYASPSVRKLARERGIDLTQLTGTGDHGRITQEDVEGAESADGGSSRSKGSEPAAGDAPGSWEALGLAPWPKVDFERFGETERVPLSKIQNLSAKNLARNWTRIPHVTQHDEADITDLEAYRKELNAQQPDVKVTMVALLLKACARALREFPRFNSALDGDELVLRRYVNIGFAADTEDGLVVPVVRDVDRKGVFEIAGEVAALAEKARAGKLTPTDMSGGTFSLSSLGGIGGTAFTPIINAPEVAILGAVRHAWKPSWNGEAFEPRLMLPLSLSYDHRVIDGAAAARFVVYLTELLGDYRRVIL